MKILKICIWAIFICSSIMGFSQESFKNNPSLNNLNKNDSIFYLVHLVIESYSRTEIIIVNRVDSVYFANIEVESTLDDHKMEKIKFKLTSAQIDTLVTFEKSLYKKQIRHNQGVKIAGRIGRYIILYNDARFEFKSRELYGLVYALGIIN